MLDYIVMQMRKTNREKSICLPFDSGPPGHAVVEINDV